ncbi:MAG: hypothetical protein JST50_13075 [Bacteroidetes bacterium]|jgi:hypothetical protein|nr:hypothetical protein [Bacteroidota bacterium]
MKMLMVLGLHEDETRITEILKEAGVTIYSRFNTTGSVGNDKVALSDEWFAATAGQANSIAYFSFVEDQRAANALALIKKVNDDNQTQNAIHGFIVPVEAEF